MVQIAARFGITDRLVNQRLAIADIIEPILNAYSTPSRRVPADWSLRCL